MRLTVKHCDGVAVLQKPSMWENLSIDVQGLPRLPPYGLGSFMTEAEAITKVEEIVASNVK